MRFTSRPSRDDGATTHRPGLCTAALAILLAAAAPAAAKTTQAMVNGPAAAGGVVTEEAPGTRPVVLNAPSAPDVAPPAPVLRFYDDGGRRFRMAVPAGWSVRKEVGSTEVTLLSGDTTLSIAVEPAGFAQGVDHALDYYERSIRAQCPSGRFSDRKEVWIAGLAGRAFTLTCPGPRQPTYGQFAVAAAPGGYVAFNLVSPTADLPAVQPAAVWVAATLQVGAGPSKRPRTPAVLRRWAEVVQHACQARVFSPQQCADRLEEARRDAEAAVATPAASRQ